MGEGISSSEVAYKHPCRTKHIHSKHNYPPVCIFFFKNIQRQFHSWWLINCHFWSSVQRKLSNNQSCPFLLLIRIMLVVELINLLKQDNCLCTTLMWFQGRYWLALPGKAITYKMMYSGFQRNYPPRLVFTIKVVVSLRFCLLVSYRIYLLNHSKRHLQNDLALPYEKNRVSFNWFCKIKPRTISSPAAEPPFGCTVLFDKVFIIDFLIMEENI